MIYIVIMYICVYVYIYKLTLIIVPGYYSISLLTQEFNYSKCLRKNSI